MELDGKSLGRGTSGVVERGRQGCTPVAVKFGVEGDEIAVLDALKVAPHRNILPVFGTTDGTLPGRSPGIVMQLCQSDLLKWLLPLRSGGGLAPHDALNHATQVAGALRHLHELNIVHRDIKANNVFLQSEKPFVLALSDFGRAHRLDGGSVASTPGGSALWLPPEMLPPGGNDKLADKAADIYMFGGVLFEILTCGRTPFFWAESKLDVRRIRESHPGLSTLELAEKLGKPVPWKVDVECRVGRSLLNLAQRCLSRSPTDRPSIDEIVRELVSLEQVDGYGLTTSS